MFDGLLGRSGFSSKCKSLIKPTRTRIEVLRRRAEAKQRFLKEDLVKLLANGLDVNAYGRTEDFIAGLNLLSCYSFIEQSCEYILKQLSVMQKLGQCPEECRETVASLMFAAARFSDLPELRDLRDVFQERYGTGLECYVNQVFVEKTSSDPPMVEKRIKLLQDIAMEFSIQWDSKGFKQRMDKPSMIAEVLHNGGNVCRKEALVGREEKRESASEKKNDTPLMKTPRTFRDRKPEILGNATTKAQEKETIRCYNRSLPPPYVKSNSNIPPPYSKPKVEKKQDDRDGVWEDRRYQNDIPLPKPRSIRRKHSKSSSSHDDNGSSEDARIVKRISSSRRKERKGLQILFDDEQYQRDDEEKMMDKLLIHYSKKPSAYDVGKLRKKKSSRSVSRSKDEAVDVSFPPTRSISLPHEHSGEAEAGKKVYARAQSFQGDIQAPHVHPKLPDYDDLAARFAALRGQ